MTCESCKGTRRITLAYSVVDCLDCAKPASLPAAPMAKCSTPLHIGDRVRLYEFDCEVLETGVKSRIGDTLVRFRDGTEGVFPSSHMKKEDTI
jgi:hypothetical protein